MPTQPPTSPRTPLVAIALSLILLAAALLRFGLIGDQPPGLWFDEALNGQDAAAVWGLGVPQPTGFQLIYPDVFPREPMFVTILALSVKLLGPTVAALRIVPALIGLLSIALLFGMLRREAGVPIALAASASLAVMRWHALFSHLVFRTILLGPWLIAIVWAALALVRDPGRHPARPRAILLGALVGGGFYIYLSWIFMLPLVAAILVWVALRRWREPLGRRDCTITLLAAAVVFAPLGIHYIQHPSDLFARAGSVSVFSEGLGPGLAEVGENTLEALGMFHFSGDHVAIQNFPRRWAEAQLAIPRVERRQSPALDPIQGLLLLAGLIAAIAALLKSRVRQHLGLRSRVIPAVLLLWLVCGIQPTIWAKTDSPNMLRTLCLTPALAALCGIGIIALFKLAASRAHRTLALALCILLAAAPFSFAALGLRAWSADPETYDGLNGPIVALANSARETPPDTIAFIPAYHFSHRSFQYILLSAPHPNVRPYGGEDGRDWSFLAPGELMASPGQPVQERWIYVTASNGLYQPLAQLSPDGYVVSDFKGAAGNTWALVYAIPEAHLPKPADVARTAAAWPRDLRF